MQQEVIQKVRSLIRGGEGGSLKSEKNKTKGGVLTCVYVRFFKKNAVFPIDYNGRMKWVLYDQ